MSGKSHQPKSYTYTCQHCGREYHPKEKDRDKYCSRECAYTARAKRETIKPKPICVVCGKAFEGALNCKCCSAGCRKQKARDYYHNNFKSVKETNKHITKSCKWCGKEYATNFMANSRVYCSRRCNERYNKFQEHAKRRGVYVEPVRYADVFAKDKGVCQICMLPVDISLHWKHRMSATLDHIVPLSKGGRHEPSNVQLAHRICNSIKSDSVL